MVLSTPSIAIPAGRELDFGFVLYCTTHRGIGGVIGGYTLALTPTMQIDLLQKDNGTIARLQSTPTDQGDLTNPDYSTTSMEGPTITVWNEMESRGVKKVVLLTDYLYRVGGAALWVEGQDVPADAAQLALYVTEGYNEGYALGNGFATRYEQYWNRDNTIIELGNEPELFRSILKVGAPNSGMTASDYWPNKTEIAVSYYKGMFEGVKAVDPLIKCSTPASSGYLPIYLYDRFINESMPTVEYLSWHWYDEHENLMNAGSFVGGSSWRSIFDYLVDRYDKDIIITECNNRFNSIDTEDFERYQNKGVRFFQSFLPKAISNERCKAVIVYGQMDDVHADSRLERGYGAYWFPGLDTGLPPSQQDFQGLLAPKKEVAIFRTLTRL